MARPGTTCINTEIRTISEEGIHFKEKHSSAKIEINPPDNKETKKLLIGSFSKEINMPRNKKPIHKAHKASFIEPPNIQAKKKELKAAKITTKSFGYRGAF